MFDREKWGEVFESIGKNKLRAVLTGFSCVLGHLHAHHPLGPGRGLRNGFSYDFRNTAINSIRIWGGETSKPWKGLPANRKIQLEDAATSTPFATAYRASSTSVASTACGAASSKLQLRHELRQLHHPRHRTGVPRTWSTRQIVARPFHQRGGPAAGAQGDRDRAGLHARSSSRKRGPIAQVGAT